MGFHSESFRFEGGGRQTRIGLKRTGKSCRLRWVNYLHPGLKRGKMTPHEERLVLQLHSKWGNRWSRIARKLPGRTDNEIKNYWRTHMRKKAQENKKASSPSSSSISNYSSTVSSSSNLTHGGIRTVGSVPVTDEQSFYDTGGLEMVAPALESNDKNNVYSSVEQLEEEECYSMDEIWKDIDLLEDGTSKPIFFNPYGNQPISSHIWDYHWPESFPVMSMMEGQGQGQVEVDKNSNIFFPAIARLTG